MQFVTSRTFLGTVAAIVATGALLNLAGKGTFGSQAKTLANFITSGYGAGAIN
ncbi:MAG: hypothetical protein SFU99_03935 [Saprospiraceae bacterium]|nr:hypothetical protein [Saprospiraceae bacterium]